MQIIARIHTDFPTKFGVPRQSGLASALESTIVFEPEFRNPDALRGIEIGADVLLMAKNAVDGVYSDDPRTNPDAVMYEDLDYGTVLAKQLKVADATAISLCMDNSMPIVVFNLLRNGNIARAVAGERIGTLISDPA